MIIADTNVWSEPLHPEPDRDVIAWIRKSRPELAITAISIGELLDGVHRLPLGRRRQRLADGVELTIRAAAQRVFSYDEVAARTYADVLAKRRDLGRPISTEDAMIAAICLANGLPLATRNVRDFDGIDLEVINPWEWRGRQP